MKKMDGFTLIELIIFIIITALLSSTILLALSIGTQKMPAIHQQIIATQLAQKCMEWFIGQNSLNGYASLTCPNTSTPAFCTAPSGFTVSTNITCTTIAGEAGFKTISVSIGGLGNATLTTVIAEY